MAVKKAEVSVKLKSVTIKAIPDNSITPQRKYSNFVQVQNTPHDVTLRFCDIGPIYDMDEFVKSGQKELAVPVVSEIVIPVNLLPNLIKALQQKHEEYQKIRKIEDLGEGKTR